MYQYKHVLTPNVAETNSLVTTIGRERVDVVGSLVEPKASLAEFSTT